MPERRSHEQRSRSAREAGRRLREHRRSIGSAGGRGRDPERELDAVGPARTDGGEGAGETDATSGLAPADTPSPPAQSGARRPPRLGALAPLAVGAASNGRPRLKKLRIALVLVGLGFLAVVSWIFGIMMAVAQDLPDLENRAQFAAAQNSVVYDSTGETEIATLTNNEGRILVDSTEIAPTMKEAVVAIEDRRFYEHRGVDFQGIARAVYQDVLSGSAEQGASTITQQFVKNALEAQDSRTIFQKLRESALAYHLERKWSKDKILTEYLNSVYFGEGAYGIEAASRTYFAWNHPRCGTDGEASCASQLLPWEAASLAAIIPSPDLYSPRANPQAARDRRDLVLDRMAEEGYITETDEQLYLEQDPPRPDDIRPLAEDSEAPYFTSWLRQQLVDQYGAGEAFGGGLRVVSTLDLELQQQAEGIVESRLAGIDPTAAVVVIDNDTGGMRAMVGGSDFEGAPFNLATQGLRQPGSSFKPFTLVTALEAGRSPEEVFTSEPKEIPFEGAEGPEIFEVANYEDSYNGSITLAQATTLSDNSVYAELGTQLGPENIAETAYAMGIESKLSTNPAMILGGLEQGVTPLEMAHAYSTLAQDGKRVSGSLAASPGAPVAIERVTEGDEEDPDLVETDDGSSGENKVETEQAIDSAVAEQARSILSTVVTSGTGTNAQTGEPTWGKTGTTDDNGDAWFVGATEDITVAVWVGHADSNESMLTEFGGQPVDGGTYSALIFHDVVLAFEELQAARGIDDEAEEVPVAPATTTTPTTTTPTTTVPTTTPAEPAPAPEEQSAPDEQPTPEEQPAPDDGGTGGATQD